VKYYTKKARQAGMTLIELTVVLLVLIGLAGLMIPYVSGFVSKTHDSTGSFNSAALDANIQRYQAEKIGFPNNMESLIDATSNVVYANMMESGFYTASAATMPAAMSLSMVGITDLYPMDDATDNATFRSTGANISGGITGASILAKVAPITAAMVTAGFPEELTIEEHLAAAFERDVNTFDSTCYDYVVMGIGEKSDLIGSTMNTAPVHFASQGAMGPALKYNRFVAVFQVDKVNATVPAATPIKAPGGVADAGSALCGTSVEGAKFIGSAMSMAPMSGHLWGTAHSLAHTWENVAAN